MPGLENLETDAPGSYLRPSDEDAPELTKPGALTSAPRLGEIIGWRIRFTIQIFQIAKIWGVSLEATNPR